MIGTGYVFHYSVLGTQYSVLKHSVAQWKLAAATTCRGMSITKRCIK
jgi:hypothetical protein